MQFITLYKKALTKYIAQEQRTHYSLAPLPDHPVFSFGIFSWFRHSQEEYPALQSLRASLESDASHSQCTAINAIKNHFMDANNKWNHHSFNSYFLDEIYQNCTRDEWQHHWQQFDPTPIEYFHGIVFRGTGDSPVDCFRQGLFEKNTSTSINDYIKDMNGSIGLSTSTSFSIAMTYALPRIDPRHDTFNSWDQSYIYLIDYNDDYGIDLEKTFLKRGQNIRAGLSADKAEVNIIKHIDASQIIGAFYVDRSDLIKWHHNKNYHSINDEELLLKLKNALPTRFYNTMIQQNFRTTHSVMPAKAGVQY